MAVWCYSERKMGTIIEQANYEELSFYTINHSDPSFTHQQVVDAFAEQTATENDRPIRLVFALIGLFLYVKKQFSRRQILIAYVKLGQQNR